MTPVDTPEIDTCDAAAAASPRPRLTHYEFALVALGMLLATTLAYFNLARLPADTDMFWHIANGREMAQTHSIPQHDNLSWYGAEKHLKTSTQEWLFDYTVFQVFSVGGFRLVYAVTAALFGVLFWLVFALTWTRTGRSIMSLGVAVLAMAGSAQSIAPRPQTVSFVLLVGVALLLERRWWLAVLPLVLLVANAHGATYPIFLLVIAYYAYRQRPWLVAVAAACVAVNPQNLALLALPFQGLSDPATARYIQEFQPPTLTGNWPLFVTLVLLALLLRSQKVPRATGLFALALAGLALLGSRYGVYVFLLVVPLLAPYFPMGAGHPVDSAREPTRVGAVRAPRWLQVLLCAEIATAALVLLAIDAGAKVNVHRVYPSAAVRYMKAHGITRVFNAYDDGGYLLFVGVPSLIDGRGIQFGPILNRDENLFREYVDVLQLRSDYRPFLSRLDIRYLLLPKKSAMYRALTYDQSVEVVYEDAKYTLMTWDPNTQ